ncbi:MAG: L-dehydroascorbate transporter large permease subunit [Anaerosporomusa subterranea]|nr:L-dehydroascorbate transporter large permease subunit [Anaerosporomusa subterranea]
MTMTMVVFVASLLAVMALGIPIAFALIMSGVALLLHMGMFDTKILAANLTPVLMPIVHKAGINPIYFGFMFVFNNMIGCLTPPVGTVLNVAAGVGKITMHDIIRCVMPYMWIKIILLLLLTLFPQLVLVPLSWFI